MTINNPNEDLSELRERLKHAKPGANINLTIAGFVSLLQRHPPDSTVTVPAVFIRRLIEDKQ
jgi:hypothetical protein